MPTEYPRASAIRETLRAKLPNLDAGTRGFVVRALIESGHVHDDFAPDHLYARSVPLSPTPPRSLRS
jgi:hypothetical protein